MQQDQLNVFAVNPGNNEYTETRQSCTSTEWAIYQAERKTWIQTRSPTNESILGIRSTPLHVRLCLLVRPNHANQNIHTVEGGNSTVMKLAVTTHEQPNWGVYAPPMSFWISVWKSILLPITHEHPAFQASIDTVIAAAWHTCMHGLLFIVSW